MKPIFTKSEMSFFQLNLLVLIFHECFFVKFLNSVVVINLSSLVILFSISLVFVLWPALLAMVSFSPNQ